MKRFLAWLGRVFSECTCPHSWGPVLEVHHKGYGVAEIICQKCGKRDVYEFWYGEEDDEKHGTDKSADDGV